MSSFFAICGTLPRLMQFHKIAPDCDPKRFEMGERLRMGLAQISSSVNLLLLRHIHIHACLRHVRCVQAMSSLLIMHSHIRNMRMHCIFVIEFAIIILFTRHTCNYTALPVPLRLAKFHGKC